MRHVIWVGIKWPYWHTLVFSSEIAIDMRFVSERCQKDAGTEGSFGIFWKKWAVKHEYEQLKEGAWLEPRLALLRKKVKENWTEKHRNEAMKIFLESGWTQKKLFDVGWSDVSQCEACQMEEGTEKHKLHHCPERYEVRREIPDAIRKLEQKVRTSKKEWKWQRGIVVHPLSESQWNKGHFSMRKCKSQKHKSWGMPAEGFKGHVATDGSLLGAPGKWGARGWAVVQLDSDEEMGPLRGMCGSMEADHAVQRSFLVPPQQNMWTYQGPCGQQWNN